MRTTKNRARFLVEGIYVLRAYGWIGCLKEKREKTKYKSTLPERPADNEARASEIYIYVAPARPLIKGNFYSS